MCSDEQKLTKRCSACQVEKVSSEFRKGSTGRCKNCKKKVDRERHRRVIQEKKDWLYIHKESTPCTDCNMLYHPWVMEFDHLRDKKSNISTLANTNCSLKRLLKEVEKCELVCANCHRLRTFRRFISS